MSEINNGGAPGALVDLPFVADFLGQPLSSVRRWIHHPPVGFPRPIMIGRKIVLRAAELVAWAQGSTAIEKTEITESAHAPIQRPRGRPPKQHR